MPKIKPVPNWRTVARRSYSFTLSGIGAIVGVGAALHQIAPALVPFLKPETAVSVMGILAALAAVGRLIDQDLKGKS